MAVCRASPFFRTTVYPSVRCSIVSASCGCSWPGATTNKALSERIRLYSLIRHHELLDALQVRALADDLHRLCERSKSLVDVIDPLVHEPEHRLVCPYPLFAVCEP
jgi:hypothetical protein